MVVSDIAFQRTYVVIFPCITVSSFSSFEFLSQGLGNLCLKMNSRCGIFFLISMRSIMDLLFSNPLFDHSTLFLFDAILSKCCNFTLFQNLFRWCDNLIAKKKCFPIPSHILRCFFSCLVMAFIISGYRRWEFCLHLSFKLIFKSSYISLISEVLLFIKSR